MVELFFLLPLAVFALVIVVAVRVFQAAKRRREAIASWAFTQGMSYAHTDNSMLGLGFHLFGLGEGRGCDNVVSGTWQGHEARVADYWYYTRSGKDRSRSYSRFSVAALSIDAVVPGLRVERENPITWLADRVGLRDITFESEEFNRRFDVHCEDREFAFKLLDARMMEWLLHTGGRHCYEVRGSWLLAYSSQLPPAEVPALLSTAKAFVERVPRLVWADYGKASS